jgi:hypothetical protein
MKTIYYFDEQGMQQGSGQSHDIVPGSTDTTPPTIHSQWNGEEWITPSTIYHYDATTGRLKEQDIADLDPLTFESLVPANATLIAPPDYDEKTQIPVHLEGAWSLLDISSEVMTDLKAARLLQLKADRESLQFNPINGISVSKESHRSDLKEYAALLKKFESATEEERVQYSGLINEDGSINWTLADDTVRPVTAQELENTYQYFFIRKGVLMGAYQSAIKQLYEQSVQTVEQINAITLEV